MKINKKQLGLLILLGIVNVSYSQNSLNSSGEVLTGTGSISYSVGQLAISTITDTGSLLQGVQVTKEQISLGVDDVISIASKTIFYPNPTVGDATLQLPSDSFNVSYRLFSAQGKELFRNKVSSEKTVVPTSNLRSGIYYLQVVDKNNSIKTFKIIKQ